MLTVDAIAAMREWVAECEFPDASAERVAEMPDDVVISGVRRHYDGGIGGFLADQVITCRPAPECGPHAVRMADDWPNPVADQPCHE